MVTYLQQGGVLVTQGQYEEAGKAYSMAAQINRTHTGLFNPDQAAIIDRVLYTLLQQEKWQEFSQQLAYLDSFNLKSLNKQAERLAATLVNQSDWEKAAAAKIPNPQRSWYPSQVSELAGRECACAKAWKTEFSKKCTS